jgi:hypothetical protein
VERKVRDDIAGSQKGTRQRGILICVQEALCLPPFYVRIQGTQHCGECRRAQTSRRAPV